MADIKDPENTIIMTLIGGDVIIELLPDVAPQHVERMKTLARNGDYDNVAFHRVIDGFMAQTGDVANANMEKNYNPSRAGTGGSDLPAPLGWRGRRTQTLRTPSSSSTLRTMTS